MDFPDWQALTPEAAAAELPRLLAAAEEGVAALEAAEPATYEALVWRLDDATRDLWRLWGRVEHLVSVMNAPAWRALEESFQGAVVAFALRVGQSRALYGAARRVLAAGDGLSPARRRILEEMAAEAERSGVGLAPGPRARFNEIQTRLSALATAFANAVIDATRAFSHEKDGTVYTIDDAHYPETMKNCPDREVRERLWRARVSRAPENGPRVREILSLRAESAALLGFADYASLSLSRKCAGRVAAVMEMIDALDGATRAGAEAEEAARAAAFPALSEPWDAAYCAERMRERTFAYSEEELKRCFELDDVLRGLFRLTRALFGVETVERDAASRPSAWHPDVRFFAVLENGREIGHFYLDAFVRNGQKRGGAWMNDFRARDDRRGETPLAVLVLNLPPRDADGRCFLPMREVETLFHEFGHVLQCVLTRVGEPGAAGTNLVEWDAVEVASQFMECWCLDDRTGLPVPAALKEKVRAARTFRAATFLRRQLAFARLDLRLHAGAPADDPLALQASEFRHFGLPVRDEDRFLCSFCHIFAGGYAAGYYGYLWSDVMSADCYGAFEEARAAGGDAERETGRRYRETVLACGGSENALAVFRRFRGRDPDIAALMRQRGLR